MRLRSEHIRNTVCPSADRAVDAHAGSFKGTAVYIGGASDFARSGPRLASSNRELDCAS